MGTSMGGYAAVAFSRLLELDIVLGFSPQVTIEEEFDTRWQEWAKQISWRYRIAEDTISEHCHFYFFYDNKDRDRDHISRFRHIIRPENLSAVAVPYAGHPVAQYFAETGSLKELVLAVFNEAGVRGLGFRGKRQQSGSYCYTLSIHLLNKRRPEAALKLIERAISNSPHVGEYQRMKGEILDRLGFLDQAIGCVRQALLLQPDAGHSLVYLDQLLERQKVLSG